jgi:hypothetical protein
LQSGLSNSSAGACIPPICPPIESKHFLERMWAYQPLLPEWDIKASVNSAGQLQRLRIALSKMFKGVMHRLVSLSQIAKHMSQDVTSEHACKQGIGVE